MVISQMLLKYEFDRVFFEAEEMVKEMKTCLIPEVLELSSHVERKIKQLKGFQLTLSFMKYGSSSVELTDIYDAFRRIKIELRLDRRKWKRIQTMDARFRKHQEREANVETFVA